jgi:hypothetical protein
MRIQAERERTEIQICSCVDVCLSQNRTIWLWPKLFPPHRVYLQGFHIFFSWKIAASLYLKMSSKNRVLVYRIPIVLFNLVSFLE